MVRPYKRSQRVSELLKEEISQIIQDMKDRRKGFVTVTHVWVSDDLRHAKVYVSIYGDEQSKERTLSCLEDAKGFVRTQIAKRVRMRYIPSIKFEFDSSLEESQRVWQILKDLKNESTGEDNTKD
jgi:ribosome-binding factor A